MQPWNHRGAESPRQEVRLSLIDLDLDRLLPFPLSRDFQKKTATALSQRTQFTTYNTTLIRSLICGR